MHSNLGVRSKGFCPYSLVLYFLLLNCLTLPLALQGDAMTDQWISLDEPVNFYITVQGQVSQRNANYLGLTPNVCGEPNYTTTTLTGQIIDQAALIGVINSLYGMGFPLLAVKCQPISYKTTVKGDL